MHKTIRIEGMSCEHCSSRIEMLLNRMDGVSAKVDLASKTADVDIASDVSDESLRETVENAGYQVVSID
ncbi:hypothetical protein CE91St36_03720 [Christensenellaceae bacterium]|nr:hypothetical protein CE91St36_03720 [Christensenellaceae bacterium]BDF60223.1 hypothetical protein CE91St37_03730 [Christensenellaceae bacterium]